MMMMFNLDLARTCLSHWETNRFTFYQSSTENFQVLPETLHQKDLEGPGTKTPSYTFLYIPDGGISRSKKKEKSATKKQSQETTPPTPCSFLINGN